MPVLFPQKKDDIRNIEGKGVQDVASKIEGVLLQMEKKTTFFFHFAQIPPNIRPENVNQPRCSFAYSTEWFVELYVVWY